MANLTRSPQLEETAADNSADALLYSQLSIKVDAEIWYDRDRLNDVITHWERTTAKPLQLRLERIQLQSTR